jgi:hypothetical protein
MIDATELGLASLKPLQTGPLQEVVLAEQSDNSSKYEQIQSRKYHTVLINFGSQAVMQKDTTGRKNRRPQAEVVIP